MRPGPAERVSGMDVLAVLASGLVAGLGVAVPLGAISVLLLGEGIARGFRRSVPAATAVGLVDTLYAAVAVALGAVAAPLVAAWSPWPTVVGGGALVAIAAAGLWRSRAAGAQDADGGRHDGPGWRRFIGFFGLTAINPATMVYFAAITVGLADLLRKPAAAALFVGGVGIASLAWQLVVVGVGGALGRRATAQARRATAVAGNLIVAGLGVAMLLRALA
mgnify:CR=1 FL=1